jgi:hypothetical protein
LAVYTVGFFSRFGSALPRSRGLIHRAIQQTTGDLVMTSRRRVWIIFMITLAIILAQANLASSQTNTSASIAQSVVFSALSR